MLPTKKQIKLKKLGESKHKSPKKAIKGKSSPSVLPHKPAAATRTTTTSLRKTSQPPYRDFSNVLPPLDYIHPTRIDAMNVAQKVHHMLSQKEYDGLITWMPHGRAFKVLVPALFEIHVCERYFGHRSYATFINDLQLNEFKYISNGKDEGGKQMLFVVILIEFLVFS